MHPVSVIAIAASHDQERLTREIFGDEVGWVPWQRPGFDLGLVMQEKIRSEPAAERAGDGPARADQLGRRRQGLLST